MQRKQSISDVVDRLGDPFKHFVIGQVDDYCVYLVRIEGEYLFHEHPKDEMYLVLEGEMVIDSGSPSGPEVSVTLGRWESLVVRGGERHRSRSDEGALVLMFKAQDLFAE